LERHRKLQHPRRRHLRKSISTVQNLKITRKAGFQRMFQPLRRPEGFIEDMLPRWGKISVRASSATGKKGIRRIGVVRKQFLCKGGDGRRAEDCTRIRGCFNDLENRNFISNRGDIKKILPAEREAPTQLYAPKHWVGTKNRIGDRSMPKRQ